MALSAGVRSPTALPGKYAMKQEEMEAKLHEMTQLALELSDERELQARSRARDRVMRRDDVITCEIRPDGTLRCLTADGTWTLRPAGWRGRA